MVKAIATDLDGTLFYPKKRITLISKKNKEFLKNALDKNIEIILVTGRNYNFKEKVENHLDIENKISIIACSGALVVNRGKILEENCLRNEDALFIYNALNGYPGIKNWMMFTSEGVMYVEPSGLNKAEYLAGFFGLTFQLAYYTPFKCTKKKFLEKLNDPSTKIYKIMPWFGYRKVSSPRAVKASEEWSKKYGDKFNFFYSDAAVEIMPSTVSKSNALNNLLSTMNIKKDEVFVVGDSGNDVPLFKEYENSFVMEQALNQVKKEAKYVISSVSDLEKYI